MFDEATCKMLNAQKITHPHQATLGKIPHDGDAIQVLLSSTSAGETKTPYNMPQGGEE